MMMEESQLGQVLDPAFGSYWHENLTDKLAEAAWTKFQEIEAIGGIETYLSNGQYNADIEAATAARAERDAPILGVSLHPAKDVKMPELRK